VGAADALRGLQLASELQPAVILMDAALPGLSGWDAIKRLKSDPATASIPVLMLTGHVLGDAKERAIAVGASGFIAKPCLPDELARQVLALLQNEHRSDV
jgi:CheY-like chemotaxis protein